MKSISNRANLELLAASQWGMFTTAQAQELGIRRNQISRMVDKNRAEMVCYGVYRFTLGDETPELEIKAAWMSIYPKENASERLRKRPFDSVVAGRTAAAILGIGDYHPSPFTFIVQKRKQSSRHDIKYLLWSLDERDVTHVNSLPVTKIERTIADLIRLREDPDLIDKLMADAARKGFVIEEVYFSELLAPLAARNGYPQGDGEMFAKDLLSKNMANIQIERVLKSMGDALKTVENNQIIMQNITNAIPKMSETIAESGLYNISKMLQYFSGELLTKLDSSKLNDVVKKQLENTLKDNLSTHVSKDIDGKWIDTEN